MICQYNKYPEFREGSGIIWDSDPTNIVVKKGKHTCTPDNPLACLNAALFEASQAAVGQPNNLLKMVFEELVLKFYYVIQ